MLSSVELLLIGDGLLNIALNIESVARSLWDGKTEVKSNATWDGTETDKDTPHLVDSKTADTTAVTVSSGGSERTLEALGDDKHDKSTSHLTNTLHGEDGTHHGSTPLGGSELRSDNGRKWVVTTNSNTHNDTPEDDDTNDGNGWRGGGESLSQDSDDHDNQLKTVHLLTTDNIGESTESQLTEDSSGRGGDLDGSVLRSAHDTWVGSIALEVDDTQHNGEEGGSEDLVLSAQIPVA